MISSRRADDMTRVTEYKFQTFNISFFSKTGNLYKREPLSVIAAMIFDQWAGKGEENLHKPVYLNFIQRDIVSKQKIIFIKAEVF